MQPITARTTNQSNMNSTIAFFSVTDSKTKNEILSAIAKHYGISQSEALEEVTGEEAESLLDYLTGSIRTATSLLMKRHGIA
jgi:hypothetical protein